MKQPWLAAEAEHTQLQMQTGGRPSADIGTAVSRLVFSAGRCHQCVKACLSAGCMLPAWQSNPCPESKPIWSVLAILSVASVRLSSEQHSTALALC